MAKVLIIGTEFWFVLLIAMSLVFIIVGVRNYFHPEKHAPGSPLGRYLLRINQSENNGNTSSPAQHVKIVRLDAIFAISTGVIIIIVMLVSMLIL